MICQILDEIATEKLNRSEYSSYSQLITYVSERPGHNRRYAVDASKIKNEVNWKVDESFKTGIRKKVEWYLKNQNKEPFR